MEYEQLPAEEFDRVDLYATYTLAATSGSHPTGQWFVSDIACETQTGKDWGDWCEGNIELIRYDIPKEIHWRCKKCGDHGKIINFDGTFWDFRNLPEEEKMRRADIIDDSYPDDDLDPFDILENMDESETLDLLGALDQYMKGIGGDMTRTFGNLSSQEVYRFLGGDWTHPENIVYLRDDMPLESVENSFFLHNARGFLRLMKDEGKFDVTKELGNLNRKSITKIIEVCRWPEGYLEVVRRANEVINEDDIWLLKVLRVLLDLSGMIHKKKDAFYLTKKNSYLIEDSQAGKLYRLLFSTMFRKMNLSYIGRDFDEVPSLQDSTPFILYRLRDEAQKWISSDKLADRILLATAYEELDLLASYSPIGDQLYYYMLRPLGFFGLIESRYTNGQTDLWAGPPKEFRITPLFEQFITFNVGSSKSAGKVIPISKQRATAHNKDKRKAGKTDENKTIYQLKVTLNDVEPKIWRRILVPSDTSLPDVHKIIQSTMGWTNSHLHQFIKNGEYYGPPDEDGWGTDNIDYRHILLGEILDKEKQSMIYEYDFGDGWKHKIKLEKIISADPDLVYPACTGGARNCPPEDCGGPWGYTIMLEAIDDPGHEEHEMYKEWLVEDFDPEYFDEDEINTLLQRRNYGCLEL